MSASITSSQVVEALIADRSPDSGWVTCLGKIVEPREIWLADAQMWVRADGSRASGWRGNDYFSERFGWLARLRIRQAVRWWAKRLPVAKAGTSARSVLAREDPKNIAFGGPA